MNSKRKWWATSFIFWVLLVSAVQAAEKIEVNVNLQVVSCVANSNKKDCNTTLVASLVRADNGDPLPIANETIAFYQDGIGRTTVRTKSNGQATKVLKTPKGTHTAQAQFVTHNNYSAHSPSGVVTYTCVVPDPPIVVKLSGCKTSIAQYDYYDCQATASGGNGGPYSFYLATMGGFPPMNVILAPNGDLSGKVTSPPPGPYSFAICANDTGGNISKKCYNFGIKVKPCPRGKHADPIRKECVSDKEEPTCPTGQHYDTKLKKCVDDEFPPEFLEVPLGTYNVHLTGMVEGQFIDGGSFTVINADSKQFAQEQYEEMRNEIDDFIDEVGGNWSVSLIFTPWDGTSFSITGNISLTVADRMESRDTGSSVTVSAWFKYVYTKI